jgi:regulator of PEP synthase PpsR (kinase-PPPase family)
MSRRTVFYVSDETGVTAETLGKSLMTQFDDQTFRRVTVPFVSTPDKAREVMRTINATGRRDGCRPIVFSSLVDSELREIVAKSDAFFLDFFEAFLGPLEEELGMPSAHATGRAHGMTDFRSYERRIEATNFALANDDGLNPEAYGRADLILVGVSRSGKTPTCLYLALQYGMFAANFPLTEEEFEGRGLASALAEHKEKLYGLTISPERLEDIRRARRPGSRYAEPAQVSYEVRQAEALFARYGIPYVDTTRCSIEEVASRILDSTGLERRVLP